MVKNSRQIPEYGGERAKGGEVLKKCEQLGGLEGGVIKNSDRCFEFVCKSNFQ